jgi:segregation and condensation protein B
MTWRELLKSTVNNLRALLGFSPSPAKKAPPLSPPATHKPTPGQPWTGEVGDKTARPLQPPAAPLRTQNVPKGTVDVALDAAAFAVAKPPRAEPSPVAATSSPEKSWTRQGVAQVEPPTMDTTSVGEPTNEGEPQEQPPVNAYDDPPSDQHVDSPGYPQDHPQNNPHDHPQNHPQDEPEDDDPVFQDDGPNDHDDRHNDEPFDDEGDDDDRGSGDDSYDNGSDSNEDDEGVALTTLLESLLFVASEPVDPKQLAQTLAQPLEIIELGLSELADYYRRSLRGLRLQRFNNKVQLVTAPAAAPFIEAFLNLDNSTKLSGPALETLAVIAYRQPVTRAQIEAVRGVDCSGVLRSLIQRGLVAEVGRLEGIGRPILYGVTELFMQHFGLVEMTELPPLEETEADRLWAATELDDPETANAS